MLFWIVWGCTGKDVKEVILEGVYNMFSFVALMDMWRHQLEGAFISPDGTLESSTDFVVQDVEYGCTVGCIEMVVEVRVGGNAMGILFGSERSHEDGIGGGMECNQDVLVATACSGGEAPGVIREEVCEGELQNGDTG